MIRFSIFHKTSYIYQYEAGESYTQIRVTPLETLCQELISHKIEVTPKSQLYSYSDFFGNTVHEFSVPFRHNKLEVISTSEVVSYEPSSDPLKSPITIRESAEWTKNKEFTFYDYIQPSRFVPFSNKVKEFSQKVLAPERNLTEAILDLNQIFKKEFKYRSGATNINTPIDEVIEKKQGVCQDFALVMIAALRMNGIAARYVSGYIESYNPALNRGLVGSEESHAWLDVYIPERSWFGLDPTNNMMSSAQHIRVANGRDFDDVSPVRGTFKGAGQQNLKVEVRVRRIDAVQKLNEYNRRA